MQMVTPAALFRAALLVLAITVCSRAADDYPLGPDSQPQEGVPKGAIAEAHWKSTIFPGTERNYWVYVPAQYDPATPACVMIFQDGAGCVDPKGQWRVPIVFDNLIAKKQMPVTIGIFIDPGVVPAKSKEALPRLNRSFEYDTESDQYARFLLDEILPEVAKSYNLTKAGNGRGIAGASSGGCCALTAAWERPREFSRVLSFIGSFVDLRGDHAFPSLIRKYEPRPIRLFQQDGSADQDIFAGHWWLANQQIDAALEFAGYEHEFVRGTLGHDGRQGAAILPDALRYIWKGFPEPVRIPVNNRQPVSKVIIPGEDWQVIASGFKFTEGPAPDREGNLFFTDIPNNRICKLDPKGTVSTFVENSNEANGLMFGADARLYACQKKSGCVVAYDKDARETIIAQGMEGLNDLVIAHDGSIYVTQSIKKDVWRIDPKTHAKKIVDRGINWPNGVTLTPDQTQLIVADTHGPNLWIFTIEPDGSLSNKQPYFTCDIPWNADNSGADGLTVDTEGRVYVASRAGIQIFDPAGRVIGVLNRPQDAWVANLKFGGVNMDMLYVASGDKLFKRKTRAHGFFTTDAPVVPAKQP